MAKDRDHRPHIIVNESPIDRRHFLKNVALSAGALSVGTGALTLGTNSTEAKAKPTIIDTHMHVWASDKKKYPYPKDFKGPPHPATVEMLNEDMDQYGCTHSVLVQVIYHKWDNTYVADCAKRFPKRFKAHGLIDPEGPNVAEKLRYWMKDYGGIHGMRFSAIYYQGKDQWINAKETHKVWRTAEELDAVFNFFIHAQQLPKLEDMVKAHPSVRIIIDHVSQIDLGQPDPEPDMKNLLAMARYPNVWVKVSELTSVSKSGKYPFTDAYPYVKRVYDAFGPDRLLFGTGYPGSARAHYKRPTLGKEIDLIRNEVPFFTEEDKTKILGLNAAYLWGFTRYS